MAVLTLAGVQQLYRVERESLQVQENTRGTPNTASFRIIQRPGQPRPIHSQEVLVTDDTETVTLFGGQLTVVEQERIGLDEGGLYFAWNCEATDWEVKLHKRRHVQRYINLRVEEIIKDVVALKAPEILTDQITDQQAVVPSYTCNWKLPAEIIKELCDFYGLTYRVEYDKRLKLFSKLGPAASVSLTDTSRNFLNLRITVDRTQLMNAVIVRGADQPSLPYTQTFTGDGIQGDFPLNFRPFMANPPLLLQDEYTGTAFNTNTWLEFDQTNPSPIPPHVGSDGYIYPYPASQTNHYTSLQVVGGPGSYGLVGLVSKALYERKAKRQFRQGVIFETLCDVSMGYGDNNTAALNDLVHGIRFKLDGTIKIMEAGTEINLPGKTYTADALSQYNVRVDLLASGAKYYIQGGPADQYGAAGSNSWTLLYSSAADTTANLTVVAVLVSSGQCAIFKTQLKDTPYNCVVTVDTGGGPVEQEVGFDNVDNGAGVDCLINAEEKQLRFFGPVPGPSTVPPLGATIVITYTYAIPIFDEVFRPDSIEAIKAIEGGDGIYEGLVVDETITSKEMCQARGNAELDQYAYPEITVTWEMPPGTFDLATRPRPSELVPINTANVNQSFLVQEVVLKHYGNDQYGLEVRAGSRLRGLEDYLQALIAQGRRFPQNDNEQLDTLLAADDTFTLQDQLTLSNGDVVPQDTFGLADALALSDGDVVVSDTLGLNDNLTLQDGPLPPYQWGYFQWGFAEWGT